MVPIPNSEEVSAVTRLGGKSLDFQDQGPRLMVEQKNRWSWDVAGFEQWKSSPPPSFGHDYRIPASPATRRARNSALSLGNRDTIEKWRDTSEHIMLVDRHKIEREQSAHLRNQVAQLSQSEQDQKSQIQQQDSTIQSLQDNIKALERQLHEVIKSSEDRSTFGTEPDSGASSNSKVAGDGMNSSAVTKKPEEELKKRDALIERLNEENEKLFDRLTWKSSLGGSPQVLAAVIKAGASREHEIFAEIRDAVFYFIRKMELKRVMDTMLVSRVRILYIRSLLAKSPELQSIKVLPVECFLEKANSGHSRSSSRGSSPGRSPVRCFDEQLQGLKVNLKPEKKSKFSTVVSKIRGIDQETWRQQVTGGKLREITEEARSFAIRNKALAALFAHTPAGELQRQVRSWLAENFEFLSVAGDDALGGSTGHLELLLLQSLIVGWLDSVLPCLLKLMLLASFYLNIQDVCILLNCNI